MSSSPQFKKFSATPLSKQPAKVLLRWEMTVADVDLQGYEFYIDAGEAGESDPEVQNKRMHGGDASPKPPGTHTHNLKPICQPISGLGLHQYLDYSAELRNLSVRRLYRIRCRNIATQEESESDVFTFGNDLDYVGMYVVDEINFQLKDTTGVPALVYPRRRSGVMCKCFDPVQKKRTISNCPDCFETNWQGGFYQPIDVYLDFSPTPLMSVIQQWGEVQPNECDMLASNYPLLRPGDVIRELAAGRMWRMVKAVPTEKRRIPMLQYCRLVEIKPGDIEYTLPVDETLVVKLMEEFERILAQREF